MRVELRSLHGKPGQVGFPGFPVENCGFERPHVVLFEENHISGTGESCEEEIRVRSEFVTFLSSVEVCGRKAPKSICQ
jgi:NAD-dependent SIR2 family protein deacetylase